MKLYAINYATSSTVEEGARCLEDLAAPQVAGLATDSSLGDKLLEIQHAAIDELREDYSPRRLPRGLEWTRSEWQQPVPGARPYFTLQLAPNSITHNILAIVVVQLVEEFSE